MSAALTEFIGFLAFAFRVLAMCLALWLVMTTAGNAYVSYAQERRAQAELHHCLAMADRFGANPEACR